MNKQLRDVRCEGYNEGWDDVIAEILDELRYGDAPQTKEGIKEYIKTLQVQK